MKKNKRKILILSLILCVLGTMSFSTLAWFNATESVTNRFYVATAKGDDPATPGGIFSIDIWEHDDKNDNGVVDSGEKDQDGMEFSNIVPGCTYQKIPYVENTGSHDQWVRALISITGASGWRQVLTDDELAAAFQGLNPNAWIRYDAPEYNPAEDTLNYVFYLNHQLLPAEQVKLFDSVKIPAHLTQEDFAKVGSDFQVAIQADAMQVEAIPVTTAKEAFAYIGWDAGESYQSASLTA